MLYQAVRIHAPYTHVPFHQRLDDGLVKFVNNDHCLLSARATLRLTQLMPGGASSSCRWRRPSGTCRPAWTPGTSCSARRPATTRACTSSTFSATPPPPEVHWPDQEPLATDGSLDERLNLWLTLVQRSEVIPAYRVFLGLLEDATPSERRKMLAQLSSPA